MTSSAVASHAPPSPGDEEGRTAMPTTHLEVDYLVLGAGAMSMGFVDVVLAEDPSATFAIVDRHANPGGHWNDVYPFVRLHQPAVMYGLNSTRLMQSRDDLSSGPTLQAYYRDAMDRFVGTGRVQFLPMSEHLGDGRIVSTVEPDQITVVTARRKTVDGTYMQVKVPSTCPPKYTTEPDVTVVPPNGLIQIQRPWNRYVVVGSGKTGIDSVLFLLDSGVAPERIQWIMPNDAWLLNRNSMQPDRILGTVVSMVQSVVDSTEIDDAFRQLERQGIVFRLNAEGTPTNWRCATVNPGELAKLRLVNDIVRLGRVEHIAADEILLTGGRVPIIDGTLFVDCTANGLAAVDPIPIFTPDRVTLQSVFMCQQTFSAALIAHLELKATSDQRRNEVCVAVPHPERPIDLASALVVTAQNMLNCSRLMPWWLRRSRLYVGHHSPIHRYLLNSLRMARLQRPALASATAMRRLRDAGPDPVPSGA
jgi:hypothetical protein